MKTRKRRARQRNWGWGGEVRGLETVVCSIKWGGQGGLVEKTNVVGRLEGREPAKCFLG